MKTLIAVPCMDTNPVGFTQSLEYLVKPAGTSLAMKPNSLVYDSRNLLSLYAIENEFDNVLWLDSDMTFPKDALTKLLAHIEKGYDMVTGLYVTRHEPVEPVIYDMLEEPKRNPDTGYLEKRINPYRDYPRNSFFPVSGCGFGCVITKTSMLKDVWDKFGPAFNPFPWAGEDISFCYRAKLLGYQPYCDSTISCGHIGMKVYSESMIVRSDDIGQETEADDSDT